MSAQRLAALSLLSVAVLHGITSTRWIGSGAAAVALVAAMLVRARLPLAAFAQLVLTFVAAAAGGAVAWLEAPEQVPVHVLGRGWSAMAVAALFAAAFRTWVRSPVATGPRAAAEASAQRGPEGGFFATFVVGLAALVASGETRTGPVYPGFVAEYILCGIAALRAHDEGRPKLSALSPRGWMGIAATTAIAAAVTVGLAVAVPPVGLRLRDRLLSSLGEPTTGLGERMVLGSMDGMLQSDEIVARVHGPPVDYLRGVVYDHYQAGQWAASSTEGTHRIRTPSPPAAGPDRVRVVLVGASRTDRYLVPLGATNVFIRDGEILVDRFGTVRPARGVPSTVEYDLPVEPPGAVPRPGDFAPSDPTQDDLRRPVKLDRELTPLVREWTAGATTREERVLAIAGRLRSEARYSLHYQRGPGDPILDFLKANPEGHCEYFASSMAMLARAAGVPARVVAGYRVTERNELGGYSIVRKRNAHAWVEVYLEGKGWTTIDATPGDLASRPRVTPFFAALWDYLAASWATARERAEAPSLLQVIFALLVFIAAALAVRFWTQRRRRIAALAEPFFGTAPPPPALLRLEKALSTRGRPRAPSETIERFAARLAAEPAGAVSLAEAADLLSRYAALRYGGVGDEAALFTEMDACAARLSAPG